MEISIEDIRKLSSASEREKLNVELKSYRKVLPANDDAKKDIACEIIAFANRAGGRIIFGLNDDGTPDETEGVNIDRLKGTLQNICSDHTSPVIECTTQVIDAGYGPLLVLYIPKRKGMPHAYITKRNGHDILSRIYYIRTEHGKRPVSDSQLEWMFINREDPGFRHSFTIVFEFDSNLFEIGDINLLGCYYFHPYRSLLPEGYLKKITDGRGPFHEFIKGLLPYMILGSIAAYFKESWQIEVHTEFERMSSRTKPNVATGQSIFIKIAEIPVIGPSYLHEISWDFKAILSDLHPLPVAFPAGCTVQIEYPDQRMESVLSIQHPFFSIQIKTGMLRAGCGLSENGTLRKRLKSMDNNAEIYYVLNTYLHFDAWVVMEARFNYPEYDMQGFEEYRNYYESIKTYMDFHWNYDLARSSSSPAEFFIINDKLDRIIDSLKG